MLKQSRLLKLKKNSSHILVSLYLKLGAMTLLFIVLFSQVEAKAGISDFLDKIQYAGIYIFDQKPSSYCEDGREIKDLSAVEMIAKAEALTKREKFCDAAYTYSEVMRQYPNAGYWKKAWLGVIDSYFRAGDDIQAINEANRFLAEMIGVPEAERVHYMIAKAIFHKILVTTPEQDLRWVNYALGISKDQKEDVNPYFKNLVMTSFVEKYPDSIYAEDVKNMTKTARNSLGTHYLKRGKFLASQRDYVEAISCFSAVLKGGPGIEVFSESLYEMIKVQMEFAKYLPNDWWITDKQLAVWLKQAPESIKTTVDRQKLAEETYQQAEKMLQMMQKNLPDDTWTQKAQVLFKPTQPRG